LTLANQFRTGGGWIWQQIGDLTISSYKIVLLCDAKDLDNATPQWTSS